MAPYEAGGGGGTFIFNVTDTFPLLVAGGGGGGGKSVMAKTQKLLIMVHQVRVYFGTGGNNGLEVQKEVIPLMRQQVEVGGLLMAKMELMEETLHTWTDRVDFLAMGLWRK